MNDREAYVAFNLTDRVGFATVEGLVREAGSVSAAWEAYPKKVSRTGGEIDWQAEFRMAEKYGVTIVTPVDEAYPPQLKGVPGRPLALYVKGDVAALGKASVALVGTRRATSYGLAIANHMAYDLAKSGFCVISGLALGIDAECHRGALDAGGVTVGVIGSGLNRFYPEENRALAREIVAHGGAVVSEFPFGRPADKTTFPIRNHVVAALAKGVVAVEAPFKSGTLITTGIAADLGRTVMAVPARVDSRMSAGCLQLIREGAVLVRNADDVIEAVGDFFAGQRKRGGVEREMPDPLAPPYTVEEALMMTHVDADGVSLDDLSRLTGLDIGKVNALAMGLRIKGFVRFLPGNRISLLTERR